MQTESQKPKVSATRKRQLQILVLFGVTLGALIVFGLAILSTFSMTNPSAAVASAGNEDGTDSGPYAGIERSFTEDGMPRLGPADAPLLIEEFSSFGCGHCANFHATSYFELLDDVRAGRISYVFMPVTNQFSLPASAATFCAGDQGRLLEMRDQMFDYLRQYGANAYTEENLMTAAEALELDIDAYTECLYSEEVITRLNDANALFYELMEQYPGEVTGTPTISLNGEPPEIIEGHRSGAPSLEYIRQVMDEANS